MRGIAGFITGATLVSLLGGCELKGKLWPEVIDLEVPTRHVLEGRLYEKRRIVSANFVIPEGTRRVCDLDYKICMVISNDGIHGGQYSLRISDRMPVQLAEGETYAGQPRTHTAQHYAQQFHLTPTSETDTFTVAAHLFWLVENKER